ncbi:MAG: metallophosphoesterase family protein [Saprospiraceae bacterium]|nr:metallophosphoesterase family protein [Saprospiraceae bacterium]MCB9319668.1 metallophosphoesterase family protein [Lewinellaceae bacterium]
MNRLSGIFIGLLCFAGAIAQEYDPFPPSGVPDRIMLNLTSSPATSMAVNWRAAVYVKEGYVEIAPSDPTPNFPINSWSIQAERTTLLTNQNAANFFSATMDGLQPATTYAYRVGDSLNWSEWNQFTTASTEAKPFSFIYFGDAQNDVKSLWSRAIRGAFQQMPKAQFMLHAGDLINRANNDDEWGEWFYAGGWMYAVIPSIATPGNHEYLRTKEGNYVVSDHWRPQFNLPLNGPEGFEETTYYIDYENTRIISFDAPAFYRSREDSTALVHWLREVLESNTQQWTVLTLHYPLYSTKYGRDNAELRSALQPMIEANHVDLVLQGHDHTYGRGTNIPIGMEHILDGPIYVVSVSGPKMYDLGFDGWIQRAGSNIQLYQTISIDGNHLTYQAYTADNRLYDGFELFKEDGHNLFFDQAPADRPEILAPPPHFERIWNRESKKDYETRFKAYIKRQGLDVKKSGGKNR